MNRKMELELWINKKTNPPKNYYDLAQLWVVKSLLGVGKVNQLILHITFAILGMGNPFFTTLHLILIVNLQETMRNVLSSIILHIDQLIQTFIMALIMIYSFAMLTAMNYATTFDS